MQLYIEGDTIEDYTDDRAAIPNSPFHGRQAHFSVPIHKNRHFHGQKKTAQSCLIREEGAKLR